MFQNINESALGENTINKDTYDVKKENKEV